MKVKKTNPALMSVALMLAVIPGIIIAQTTDGSGDARPIVSTYTLEIGGRHALSTYLSPIVYKGADFVLEGNWRKKIPFDAKWEMEFRGKLDFAGMKNTDGNASMQMFEAMFSWGMERRWGVGDGWSICGGGSLSAQGGLLYLSRNSNNPANAMARIGLNLTASASKTFRVGKLNITGFDRVSLPTLSGFFSPGYGETYYEIYLGNHRGLAHCGWWGNNFGLDNILGAELHFGKRSLILGWRYDLQTIHANNLDTQLWRNSGVVGIKF